MASTQSAEGRQRLRKLRERVSSLINRINEGLLERKEAVRLCVLCALAGESIFLLGPPGVAKSLIARRLKFLFSAKAKVFEYLMNRFSTPDEIFGPISITSLKADRLERKTDSYLPDAVVVFLDEIWKAGPSIQNALLTAVNEKIFRNGGAEQKIPLRVLVSASNELPAEGEGLEALWDRFLVRLEVGNIESAENRHQLIRSSMDLGGVRVPEEERFREAELIAFDREIDLIEIPDAVLAIVDDVIARVAKFNEERSEDGVDVLSLDKKNDSKRRPEIYVSDRRWKKISRLLRTSAVCNGRVAVNELDCYLIAYCIWDKPEQIPDVGRLVLEVIERELGPNGRGIENLRLEWESLKTQANMLPSMEFAPPLPFKGHYKIDLSHGAELLTDAEGRSYPRLSKENYASLGNRFQRIPLEESGGKTKSVSILARKGSTPAELILKNEGTDSRLDPFRETVFRLKSGPSAEGESRSLVDLNSADTVLLVSQLKAFRERLARLKAAGSETTEGNDSLGHLFVELATDIAERLAAAQDKAHHRLDGLLSEIDQFEKEKGLA